MQASVKQEMQQEALGKLILYSRSSAKGKHLHVGQKSFYLHHSSIISVACRLLLGMVIFHAALLLPHLHRLELRCCQTNQEGKLALLHINSSD